MMPRKIEEAEPAGTCQMSDGRAAKAGARLRVSYGPYVTQNRKEGPHMSTKSALRADLDAEDRKTKNQVPAVPPGLHPGRSHPVTDGAFKPGYGGARAGAGRPKGSPNKISQTFRDVLLQAVSEVGDSQEVGKDGQGGLLGFLKMCSVLERKTTLLLLGRILPQKITTEVKQLKETMTIHEAVADLKACGLDPLLAFYLKRYPIGRDEKDASWAEGIDLNAAYDLPIDVTPQDDVTPKHDDTGDDTGNDTAK
jgi:hypothetical protein